MEVNILKVKHIPATLNTCFRAFSDLLSCGSFGQRVNSKFCFISLKNRFNKYVHALSVLLLSMKSKNNLKSFQTKFKYGRGNIDFLRRKWKTNIYHRFVPTSWSH